MPAVGGDLEVIDRTTLEGAPLIGVALGVEAGKGGFVRGEARYNALVRLRGVILRMGDETRYIGDGRDGEARGRGQMSVIQQATKDVILGRMRDERLTG